MSGGWLSHYLYPPYVLPPSDTVSFRGGFFRRHGLRFVQSRRMSPFIEASQATSGRGDEPYAEGEGLGYWRSAALLLGKQQRELGAAGAAMQQLQQQMVAMQMQMQQQMLLLQQEYERRKRQGKGVRTTVRMELSDH